MHDWDDLRIFLAAAETGSFTRAARQLGVGQATISRRVAALEDRVGQMLFERRGRGLLPTPAADALRPHAERMAEAARSCDAAVQGLNAEPRGRVRIAVPPGVAVDLMPEFAKLVRRRHPHVRLDVLSDNFTRDLSRHDADIAIRSVRPESGDLLVRRLGQSSLGVFASRAVVSALPDPIDPEALEWITWSPEMAHIPAARWIAAQLGDRPPAFVTNSFLAMGAAAAADLGCVVFPGFQAHLVGLVPVPVTMEPLPDVPFWMAIPRALRQIPRVARVAELLVERVAAMGM